MTIMRIVFTAMVLAIAGDDHEHVDEVKLTADAIQRYGVKLAAVERHALVNTVSVPARVAFNAEAMAHVSSAVRGRAAEINVRLGQDVKKGDALLVVESPELGEAQSDFLQKRTLVTVAKSAVEPAAQASERARKLHELNEGIALAEVQKREAELKAAEGAVQTAQAAMVAAENKLHLLGMPQAAMENLVKSSEIDPSFVIRAPIDGQVIEREVTLGELVSPEKDALLVLANVDSLWLIADVPESALSQVAVGSRAAVKFDFASSEPVAGTVSFIAAALDPATRTAQVRIDLPNQTRRFRPGMFATAEIESTRERSERVLAVPADAIQTVEGGPAVFVPVEGEENTFAKRAVGVGETVGGMVAITSGLKEGEQLVVSGTFILKAELGKGGAAHEH